MKKQIIYCIAFLVAHFSFANTIINNQISIPKHCKTENTFSGDLSENKSFHLIFTRNKKSKNYEVFSYLFDGNNIEELPSFISKESCGLVSFHKKNDVLSLFLSFKKDEKTNLKKIDINLITKEKTEYDSFLHENYLSSIRQKDRSIFIYKSKKQFKIIDFKGNKKPLKKELVFKNKNNNIFKFFKGKSVSSVKTDEFVSNGPVNDIRLYFEKNTLLFTRDSDEPLNISIIGFSINNKKTNTTEVLKFDLNTTNLTPVFSIFNNKEGQKFKKATSFISSNKLFQLALSKKEGYIKISDLNSGKSINLIPLDESITPYLKGNSAFLGIDKFLKHAAKKKYNATITVNKTNSDKLRVRIDYVDIDYSYNSDWWWWHQQMWHQQFMWQQQQSLNTAIKSIPRGFGPRIIDDFAFENATVVKEKRYFEILIDSNGKLLNEDLPKSIYKEIDKKEHIENLEDIKNYKMESSCFLKHGFRFIAFDKKLKKFIIQTNNIK